MKKIGIRNIRVYGIIVNGWLWKDRRCKCSGFEAILKMQLLKVKPLWQKIIMNIQIKFLFYSDISSYEILQM